MLVPGILRQRVLLVAAAVTLAVSGGIIATAIASARHDANGSIVQSLADQNSSAQASVPCPTTASGYDALSIADRDTCARAALDKDLATQTDPTLLAGLHAIKDRLDSASQPHAYLLALDDSMPLGRAVVAIGDPSTAANVVVSVPGITARLGAGFATDIAHADMFVAASAKLGATTAAITWLGYDAPQDAGFDGSNAEAAAAPLDAFLNGLQQVRTQGPAHLTLIGHSYGGVAASDALTKSAALAASGGALVDDLVLIGNVGAGDAKTAADLHVNHAVWAGSGENDFTWVRPKVGNDPQSSSFKASVFYCGTVSHGDYWAGDDPSQAIDGADYPATRNMLEIIDSTYHMVNAPDPGSLPASGTTT
jgi:hypothetical protein